MCLTLFEFENGSDLFVKIGRQETYFQSNFHRILKNLSHILKCVLGCLSRLVTCLFGLNIVQSKQDGYDLLKLVKVVLKIARQDYHFTKSTVLFHAG